MLEYVSDIQTCLWRVKGRYMMHVTYIHDTRCIYETIPWAVR